MTTTVTSLKPIVGPEYDKTRPETREAWVAFRAGGITATQIRDWGNGTKRREIIMEKVTGVTEDLSHIPAIAHGNRREPVIGEWIQSRFGITPTGRTYAHAENPRHLASPDGISLDPFSGELEVGTPAAIVAEIKTSAYDLTPGTLDAHRTLIDIDHTSKFAKTNYYTQMQWQMYVMNATMTLFVWEQHTGEPDTEYEGFKIAGPPQVAWIPRDQKLIDRLVNDVAPRALAEIDAAILASKAGDLPPASDLPSEHAIIVADLLAARDAEADGKRKKEQAWKRLQELYLGEDKPDVSIDAWFAKVTVSTTVKRSRAVDPALMEKRAPALVRKYKALQERCTVETETSTQSLTITAAKK